MLETLDSINWHELSHAYGPADDIPQFLRDIVSSEKKKRNAAYGELHDTIFHQFTVYQASVFAVPFLIEIVKNKQTPERERVIELLADLIIGYKTYQRQDEGKSPKAQRSNSRRKEAITRDRYWSEQTYQAVREGSDVYLSLLRHKQRPLKLQAIHLLGQFVEDKARLVPLLTERLLVETNKYVRAGLILSLAQWVEYGSQEYALLTLMLRESENYLIKIATSMGFISMGRADTPLLAIDTLIQAMREHRTWEDAYAKLPSSSHRFVFDALQICRQLPPQMNALTVPRFLELLAFFSKMEKPEELNSIAVKKTAELILYLAFRGQKGPEDMPFEDLSDEQQQVLLALLTTDILWNKASTNHSPAHNKSEQPSKVTLRPLSYELMKLGASFLYRKDLRAYVHQAPEPYDEVCFYVAGDWDTRARTTKSAIRAIHKLNPDLSAEALQFIQDQYSG